MKHVKTSVLRPGMVTAEDVIASNNQLIFPKGLTLTQRAIDRLDAYKIEDIHIEDPDCEVEEIDDTIEVKEAPADAVDDFLGVSTDSILSALESLEDNTDSEDESVTKEEEIAISKEQEQHSARSMIQVTEQEEPSHFEKLKSSPQFKQFKQTFEDNVVDMKGKINEIVEKNAPINVDNMLDSTMKLLSTQSNSFGVFDMLHNMRQFDDLTYAHSMNVALICNVFGDWLGFDEESKKLATACGMLHDIGKLKIDDSIIKKPSKLTDEEYRKIKFHPVEGYKILEPQDIDPHIKNAALMHHEKCDGSGYPLKLTGDKIDKYAKMVAIADVYDAMTAARVYRGPLCPFAVIKIFEDEGLYKYETEYVMKFLENVINTYIDNRVQLSNGKIGTVRWIDKQHLSRPMLQMPDDSFLELSKHPELHIIKIL